MVICLHDPSIVTIVPEAAPTLIFSGTLLSFVDKSSMVVYKAMPLADVQATIVCFSALLVRENTLPLNF